MMSLWCHRDVTMMSLTSWGGSSYSSLSSNNGTGGGGAPNVGGPIKKWLKLVCRLGTTNHVG